MRKKKSENKPPKQIGVLKQFEQLVKSKARYVLMRGSTRCLAPGTEIRMANGLLKKIEDIQIGDFVYGLNGPEEVVNIHNGVCDMYKISQAKGEDYIVTEDHLLSVKQTRKTKYKIYGDELRKRFPDCKYRSKTLYTDDYDKDKIHDFTAKEFSEFSENKRKHYSGFKNTFVELPKKENKIDSYYLGLWLGDGTSLAPGNITNVDEEVIDYIYRFAEEQGLKVVVTDNITYSIRHKSFNHQTELSKNFHEENLKGNKHIPHDYIYTSYNERLKLLAGLIDSDGSQTGRNTLEITQKRKSIIEDIQKILEISGFYTRGIREKISSMKKEDGSIYKCKTYSIEFNHPDFKDLNKHIKVKRKRVVKKLDKPNYMFNTKITSTPIGKGKYYGFTLKNSPYFRLKDGTITHNSGKTVSIIQYLLHLVMTTPNIQIIIGVETLQTAKKQLVGDIEEWIIKLGLYKFFEINKTDFTYKYANGAVIRIVAGDKASKWFGIKADIFWLNEGNHIDYEIFEQAQMRLPDRTDFINRIIIDFNPTNPYSWVRDLENADLPGGVETFVSTFRDNPFLGKKQKQTIEDFKHTDYNKWLIYAQGEWGEVRGAIFDNWTTVDEFPKDIKSWIGLDFGFVNDPTAVVRVGLQNGEIFLDEIMYEEGLTNPDIKMELLSRGVTTQDEIYADIAEKKSIEELRRMGLRIFGAPKFPGSIVTGIDVMKRYKINITKRSKNLQDEFINYIWKEDKSAGKFTNNPIDAFNHLIDAARGVALEKLYTKPKLKISIR